jgi:Ca2+-binding EF-hand superfamily protein
MKDETDLKEFFELLSGDTSREGGSVHKNKLIFSLENYPIGLSKDDINVLVNNIKNMKNEQVTFDDFKKFWTTKIRREKDYKKLAQQVYQLIREIIGKDMSENGQFNKEGLKKLMDALEIQYDDKTVEQMIECIDLDRLGNIGIPDLEFLVKQYFGGSRK